jgi:DNA (cytosine-5)-methyltransferase 1
VKIGSLCTGYGGLDLAVEAHFNAQTIWCAEFDKYASQVIEQRFNIPNHGDIKSINWASLEPVDILTAGYPCQPFSHAGDRKGTEDARHIWPYIAEAISTIRPEWVILENVRGHLTLGFKEVLAQLTYLGYDVKWGIIRASDVGAPHKRERLFIVANTNSNARSKSRRTIGSVYRSARAIINWPNRNVHGSGDTIVSDTDNEYQPHDRQMQELGRRFTSRREMHLQTAPATLVEDKLNPLFVEYMMGLPAGWVTNTGLSRAQQLKMLGNGVVPQQAKLALEILTDGI